jgi:hypothetical protein
MKSKDIIVIKNYPEGTIQHETPKAICVSFEGKHSNSNTWLPKKLITIDSSQNIERHYRNITQYNISLPEWFLETDKMRLILIPVN